MTVDAPRRKRTTLNRDLVSAVASLHHMDEAAAARHLGAQVGRRHAVLMESPRLGRTEQFAEVAFDADRPTGALVDAVIRAAEGGRLLA